MSLDDSRQVFEERVGEIREYLLFLQQTDPTINAFSHITPNQQRILFSTVYLLLYNLTESTINKYTNSIVETLIKEDKWTIADLSDRMIEEWTRSNAKTHLEMNYENRLKDTASTIRMAFQGDKIKPFKIERGGGGNWDDEEIYKFLTRRIGLDVLVSKETNSLIKKPVRGNSGILKVIVKMRNDLAHGDLSFGECGANATVGELKDFSEYVFSYLEEIIASFEHYVKEKGYIKTRSIVKDEEASDEFCS